MEQHPMRCRRLAQLSAALRPVAAATSSHSTSSPEPQVVTIPSAHGPPQKLTVLLPDDLAKDGDEGSARPLVVSLHTWGGDHTQKDTEDMDEHAQQLGWIYVFPDFQGPNKRPEACGSELVQQNILEAVVWAKATYPVDASRIYLTGASGGGHMTLLMAARYPEIWAAACAFVGISDLAAWHDRHADDQYGDDTRACTGGRPGQSEAIDEQFRARSPLTYLGNPKLAELDLPLDILAGIFDGHTGSVPIRHSIDAFNAVASSAGRPTVSEAEIQELTLGEGSGRLGHKQPSDCEVDLALGREIHLRRAAGRARLTIFEGGHEGIGTAAVDWLQRFAKA
jgi:enterochelin esterase-like enzyme